MNSDCSIVKETSSVVQATIDGLDTAIQQLNALIDRLRVRTEPVRHGGLKASGKAGPVPDKSQESCPINSQLEILRLHIIGQANKIEDLINDLQI